MSEEETQREGSAEAEDAGADPSPAQEAAKVATNPRFKWYVVHTYSSFEDHARRGLVERAKLEGLEDSFGEILIPAENVVEMLSGGSSRKSKRKFFPGYMIVQMDLNDRTWHLVKHTPKITGFVGNSRKPIPIKDREVKRLTDEIDSGQMTIKPKLEFSEGETVRVLEGPFASFTGAIEEVQEDRQKLKVAVSIFGRATPVELDYAQVEKAKA